MFRFACAIVLLLVAIPCRAIQVTNPLSIADEEVDRFLDDASFLSAAGNSDSFDFTGVGFGGGWATMISPEYFLSAAHLHPSIGQTVTFYDDSGTSIASHVVASGGDCCTGTDLWLGRFSTPVDTNLVKTYAIATGNPQDYLDVVTIQVGNSGTTSPQFRVGQNRLDSVVLDITPGNGVVGTSDFAIYLDNSAAGGLGSQAGTELAPQVDYETYFDGGDSGGPTFVDDGSGNLTLLGIHSFVAEFSLDGNANTAERRGSADVFLPNYSAGISSAIAVPEPSSACFLALIAIFGGSVELVRQRNKK